MKSHILLLEMSSGTATLENSLGVPQKVKHGTTIYPSNSNPRFFNSTPRIKNSLHKKFIALFITAKNWKQS